MRSWKGLTQRTEELTQRTEELTAANSRLEAEIAQRKVAEDQLHQAQKMEALGQLTGGIAHDFNILLTAVIGNLELAQKRTGSDPHTAGLLRAALSAAERGATLIKELLTFARRQPLHPQAVDVSTVVDDAERILKQTISPDIRLLIRAEPGVRPAWVDSNQLELAILNLALNARDAMATGGRLCVVVAPSLIPKRAGDRIKTDRRDATSLAKLHRAGELTAVWVPDARHEAMRDLVRARLDAVHSLRRARQQLSGFYCARDATMAGRLGPSCIAAGWRVSSSNRRFITWCWKITSRRLKPPRRGAIV